MADHEAPQLPCCTWQPGYMCSQRIHLKLPRNNSGVYIQSIIRIEVFGNICAAIGTSIARMDKYDISISGEGKPPPSSYVKKRAELVQALEPINALATCAIFCCPSKILCGGCSLTFPSVIINETCGKVASQKALLHLAWLAREPVL